MSDISRLLSIMARLRDPLTGCPWDKKQTHASIAGYTLEEAYEVYDAIERNDSNQLKSELGDLLFHIVFYSQMADENQEFNFESVVDSACEKMIRRHPHIFGAEQKAPDWERLKEQERTEHNETGILDGIAKALPASTRAYKLQNRAARVGFDWNDPLLIIEKIQEEIDELKAEIIQPSHETERFDEMGDVLFACVNLARKLKIDPEKALKHANAKFERRFNHIEKTLKERGQPFEQTSLDEMEDLWVEAKHLERKKS